MLLTDLKNKKDKQDLVSNILNVVVLVTIFLTVFIYAISPLFIRLLSSGFQGDQFNFTNMLFRIGLPGIVFYSMAGILRGYLNDSGSFLEFGLVSFAQNIPVIVYLIAFSKTFGVKGLMYAQVIGIACQVLIQIPFLKRAGFKYQPIINFKSPYFKTMLLYLGPIVLSVIVNDVNSLVDKTLASNLPAGSITALEYGNRLNQVFLDAVISPISLVLFPMLTLAFSEGKKERFIKFYKLTFNVILLVLIPITCVLVLYSKEIITIFFARGKFDALAVNSSALAMACYSSGLIAMAGKIVMGSVFLARKNTKVPMLNSILTLVLNVIFNLLLMGPFKHGGLAIATSISSWLTFIILIIILRKSSGLTFKLSEYKPYLFMLIIGSACVWGSRFLFNQFSFFDVNIVMKIIYLAIPVGLATIVYLACIYIFDKEYIKEILSTVKNR